MKKIFLIVLYFVLFFSIRGLLTRLYERHK